MHRGFRGKNGKERSKSFWTSNDFQEFWAWEEKNDGGRKWRCQAWLLAFWFKALDEYIIRRQGLKSKLTRIEKLSYIQFWHGEFEMFLEHPSGNCWLGGWKWSQVFRREVRVGQRFSTGSDCPPPGDSWKFLQKFRLLQLAMEILLLVSRGHGCC